ncbi:MAG: protein kinase, partial [Acidimicrobiia bacterium]|nr:protein kinase [Acidimicrobiia bacterium]
MEFRVLGPVEYGNPEHPVRLGGPKQRAVFALLVKDAGDVVSSESLIDGVWGDEPPGAVRNSLHTYVSNLRSILGGKIERSGNGYLLDVDHAQVDAVLFERLVDESRSALSVDPAASGTTLRAALSLWRGRPYADLLDIPGLADEIRRLEELRLLTVEARVDADLATGRHEIVIPELEALAADYPLREGFRARHMIALYRNGRQAEALRAYNRTREFLGDELGVEPSPELAELEERILQHDPELLSAQDVRTEQVAFLFTDLEASTVLWETRPEQMRDDLAVHDEMLTKAIADAGGRVFKHTGDGILAAFGTVTDAARSAAHAQQQLAAADWGALETLRVRMSLDVGEVDARGGDYFGAPMNRGARLMAAAHGGQIVLSAAAQDQLRHESGVQIKSLGEHRFKGLGKPQDVFQLLVPGLQTEFPPLRVDAAAPDAGRQFGDSIRGYEIRERIGAGRFGMVYRAYQPSVGREVAVKVIRREYANHPVFVRRFEAEARLVAKLEHPHIVSLYDFWRDHDGAYLVMPYLVGRSLSGARYGALPTETVAAILRQIGAALSYAHRQGVIHRDVKPANILLDADGNAYLADFGIAVRAVEHSAGLTPSSQTFRAPEDRDGGAVDERTDVYSLAAVTAELLTGQTPTSGDLPVTSPSMQQALKRGLEEDPAARFPTIDSFVAALLNGAGMPASTATVPPIVSRNPYKGLAAFNEADARDFYGRDAEVADLLRLIRKQRFVTVVGPSGSGKSSLVQAGLVPALRAGRVAGSTDWLIAKTVPGAHPADELATALGDVAMQQLGDIAAELGADEHGLLRVSKQLTRETDSELLVVIDQFEELFSLVPDERTRAGFVDSLLAAIDDPHSRLRIVATIRADFFDQPLLDDRLGPVVCSALLALSVPGPEALLEAIERPAAAAGVQFEPGLAHQIVADVRDEPGGLPLMQFVLSDLVDRSELGHVDAAAYVDTGGVHGALSRRAARVLEQLDDRDRGVAEQIFLRLVAVSEDADDVRRRVRRSELESLGLDAGSVRNVLDTFGSARLLTFDRDPITRGPTVEVAHEALLREWDQLRRWVVDRRESLLIRRRLELALAEWRGSGESEDLLPAGGRLAQFEEWADNPATNLTEYEREFLIAAAELQTGQAAERERRRRAVMGGFVVAALVATVL